MKFELREYYHNSHHRHEVVVRQDLTPIWDIICHVKRRLANIERWWYKYFTIRARARSLIASIGGRDDKWHWNTNEPDPTGEGNYNMYQGMIGCDSGYLWINKGIADLHWREIAVTPTREIHFSLYERLRLLKIIKQWRRANPR